MDDLIFASLLLQAIQQSPPEKPGLGWSFKRNNRPFHTIYRGDFDAVITAIAVMRDVPIAAISGLVSAAVNSFRQRGSVCRYPAWI